MSAKRIQPHKPIRSARTRGPLTTKLLARIQAILEKEGITQIALAKEINVLPVTLCEWMGGYRSSPSGEATLRLIQFCEKHRGNGMQLRKGGTF